jgi:hypothetical protein
MDEMSNISTLARERPLNTGAPESSFHDVAFG